MIEPWNVLALLAGLGAPASQVATGADATPIRPQVAASCALGPRWGPRLDSSRDGNHVRLADGGLQWNNVPVDGERFRKYLGMAATISPPLKLRLFGYGADCERVRNVAAVIEASTDCTSQVCIYVAEYTPEPVTPRPRSP